MQIIRIAVALACLTSAVGAQEYNRGIGAWSCSEFVTQVDSTNVQVAAYSFAMGYVMASIR